MVSITACYAFLPLHEGQIAELRRELVTFGMQRGMKGLVLLATEGINATVSGNAAAIADWKARMRKFDADMIFKDSRADGTVFHRWSVKIKPEIVAIKQPDIRPQGRHRHVSPEEWNEMLKHEDVLLLDARNDYEVAIGKFRGAVDPQIKNFETGNFLG